MCVCQALLDMSDLRGVLCCLCAFALLILLLRSILFEEFDVADSGEIENFKCRG
jgi:hypothetical protein